MASSGFFSALDEVMCPADASIAAEPCHGDFRHAKECLLKTGFKEDEFFDVFHVLMDAGAYCDCEILYNVNRDNRFAKSYWQRRAGEVGAGGG